MNCHSFSKTEKGLSAALAQVSTLETELQAKRKEEEEKARHAEKTKMLLDQTPMIASEIATASDVHEMFQRVVEYARSLLDADRGTLFLLDEEKGELWSKVAEGWVVDLRAYILIRTKAVPLPRAAIPPPHPSKTHTKNTSNSGMMTKFEFQ